MKKIHPNEIRNKGLLMIINQLLHAFGYTLSYDLDTGEVYFTETHYCGFSEEVQNENYKKLKNLIKK